MNSARRGVKAEADWRTAAQEIVDSSINQAVLAHIRAQADERLAELRDVIEELNDRLHLDASDFDLPEMVVPTAKVDGNPSTPPLIDSRWSYIEQTERLIQDREYVGLDGARGAA